MRTVLAALRLAALVLALTLSACGGDSSTKVVPPASVPTSTPTPSAG